MIVGFSYWFQRLAGIAGWRIPPEAANFSTCFNIRAMPVKERRNFAVGGAGIAGAISLFSFLAD